MRRITSVLLLLALLLTGCGISREEYDAVVQERDALLTELQETQAELQELRDSSDTMTVTLKGSFTATVRALILEGEASPMAVVELFQSTPFFICTRAVTEQLEVGETYVFEIKTRENIEIPASEYTSGYPDPVDIAWYNLQVSDFRAAEEADCGLDSCHLVYET
ncbi:MAG: hypothetical protein HFF98_08685 [Oscillibacter sp.]|jgi:hypothetical protein|nr:hypothetical protein [Oscillibacter sp.]